MPVNFSRLTSTDVFDQLNDAQERVNQFQYRPTHLTIDETQTQIATPQSSVWQARSQRLELRKTLEQVRALSTYVSQHPGQFDHNAQNFIQRANILLNQPTAIEGLKRDGMLYLAADFNQLSARLSNTSLSPQVRLDTLRQLMIVHQSLGNHIQDDRTDINENDPDRHFHQVEENVNLQREFSPIHQQQENFLREQVRSASANLIAELRSEETALRQLQGVDPNDANNPRTIEFHKRQEMLIQNLEVLRQLGLHLGRNTPTEQSIRQIQPSTSNF